MNVQIQTFGLIILALLYIFYKSNRSLQLYTDMLFRRTLYISIISISLDILSVIAIEFKEQLPNILVIAVCKLYILSLVWEAATALNYVLADLFDEKRHRRTTGLLYLASLIQGIIIAFLPIYIYRSEDAVYTYGPAVLTVYIFAFCHIISTLAVIFACHKKPNKRRRTAVEIWMAVWICAALVQYFNNSLLIVGFASVFGMMILFILVENPQSNIDRRIGCFNSYALSEYSHRLFEHSTRFSLLEVSHKDSEPQKSEEYTENTLKKVMSTAGTNKDLYVFRSENDAIIISENTKLLRDFGKSLKDSLREDECGKKHSLVFVEHAEVFGNMTELFRFLAFTESSAEMCSDMYIADNDVINRYRESSLIEQEITSALNEDRVEVFLQPIYSNSEQRFTSAEALVRIRKTDGSLLRPDLFIPFAERNGQIVKLGERVFEKVCAFLKNTNAVQLGLHYVEVNLSVVQCEMEDLADRLISIIEKYGIDPHLINLEITETASVTSRSILLKNMEKLISYGFTFSLDDFGKGQSNLMYVVEMPVSIIKLDYDMSKAFFRSPKAKQVVRAVVSMAHGMNLKLVAEGIETAEEIDGMSSEKIDYIQGYYYSRPLPMNDFLEFISAPAVR